MAAPINWPGLAWSSAIAASAAFLGLVAGVDPRLGLTLALASAFAVVAFTDLSLGVAAFAFISFVELPPFGLYDALARLLLAIAWLGALATKRRTEAEFLAVHPLVAAAMLCFLCWSAISVVWAKDPGAAVTSTIHYSLSLILVLIVFTAVRSERELGYVLLAFVLGATAAGLYGLLNPDPVESGARLASAVLDANLLAAALVVSLALAAGVFALFRAPPMRLAVIALIVLSAAGVSLTGSRSGILALAVCLLAAVAVAGRWRVPALALALLLAGATYAYFTEFAPEETQKRVSEPLSGEERSEDGRTTFWGLAWRAFEDKPVAGVGSGNFRVTAVEYLLEPGVERSREGIVDEPEGRVAHSSYLSVLSELGLVGFALYMVIVGFCLVAALRAGRAFAALGNHRMQVVALSIAVAIVGILAVNAFQSDQQGKLLWLSLSLGPAVLAVSSRSAPETPA